MDEFLSGLGDVLNKGGPVGLIIAVGVAIFFILRGWRLGGGEKDESGGVPVGDAAAANDVLRKTLSAVRRESDELAADNATLRREIRKRDELITDLRGHYEGELAVLRSRLQEALLDVEKLYRQIQS